MEWKAENPANLLKGHGTAAFIEAYFEINHLKQLYRQGWLRRGIPKERCESVAEHTFGVALLAFWLAEAYFPDLDANRVIRLALLHDLGEVYIGDIIPGDRVEPEEKRQLEQAAVEKVLGKLPGGKAWIQLWEDYEHGTSPEARFVKEIDRLEMALQAGVYERQGFLEMGEFFETAGQALNSDQLLGLLQALQQLRI